MQIEINTGYITLGQLLKKLDLIGSGGEAKVFLEETEVRVNNDTETRRGRKIQDKDSVNIKGFGIVQVISIEGGSTDESRRFGDKTIPKY